MRRRVTKLRGKAQPYSPGHDKSWDPKTGWNGMTIPAFGNACECQSQNILEKKVKLNLTSPAVRREIGYAKRKPKK